MGRFLTKMEDFGKKQLEKRLVKDLLRICWKKFVLENMEKWRDFVKDLF